MNLPVQETLPFEDLAEAQTASPWCQRWRAGKHSWRHVRDGGFDARNYRVDVIREEEPAKTFVLAHHYSQSYPAVKVQFGLYDVSGSRHRLCGVAAFGVPVSTAVLTKPLPGLRRLAGTTASAATSPRSSPPSPRGPQQPACTH